MAWMPWRVPARTRYSLDVSWARPSALQRQTKRARVAAEGGRTRTGKVALVDEAAGFVDDLDDISEGSGNRRGQKQTQSPKMAILMCVSLGDRNTQKQDLWYCGLRL